MSDEKKKKSADEIVDDAAAEMGVDDAKVPESDESSENVMAGLGGIFDVPAKKKKKKKKEEVVEDTSDEDSEDEEAEEPAPKKAEKPKAEKKAEKPKSDKPKKKVEGVEIFAGGDDVDLSSPYLGTEDLGDYDAPQKSNTALYAGVVIGVLALAAGAVFMVGDVDDLGALFRGELKEKRLAEKRRIEEEHKQKLLDAQELFGTVFISGNAKYAAVKLNGKLQYGETSSGQFREVLLTASTPFQNLKVKEKHLFEITSPGFQPLNVELTQGMWNENPGGDFTYNLTANLTPLSPDHKLEYDARLSSDIETDYFGKVTINTTPPGATVMFNNHPLLNEKGEELKTPVTFEKYWVKDDKGKLEERPVYVDTTIDQGHKIELLIPDSEYPKYVTALQRQMWTCNWKSEAELKAEKYNPESDSIQKKCNYTWDFNFSFDELKQFIADRDAEIARIEAHNEAERKRLEAANKEE